MKKVSIKDIGGEVVKDNDVYTLQDNNFGNNLTLSSTFLRANKCTNGHTHAGQEEAAETAEEKQLKMQPAKNKMQRGRSRLIHIMGSM